MFAIDRDKRSCKHLTSFCVRFCYNKKLYALYPNMEGRDDKNEEFWARLDGATLKTILSRKRKQTDRFRFCTRGEAFSTLEDVDKVAEIIRSNPTTLFWIPTRGWRNPDIRRAIEARIFTLPNARPMASLDPSNDKAEYEALVAWGWSTLYFGYDTPRKGHFLCPKTWDHEKGACASCTDGCFSTDRVDVHLKSH
jgi:hypothetical protein